MSIEIPINEFNRAQKHEGFINREDNDLDPLGDEVASTIRVVFSCGSRDFSTWMC